ncbi:MAG: hypothetical protein U1C57_01890 [Candidatus Doudnabacteria bacterium]|nr:hypothetical protein [Candidatus Doudnabacteria bacterium]
MRVSVNIRLLLVLLFISTAAGYYFLKLVDPYQASLEEQTEFYVILFTWIFSCSSILGFGLRYIFQGIEPKYMLRSSARQGILFGIIAVIALILQAGAILTLWTGLLLVAVFTLIEVYVVSR